MKYAIITTFHEKGYTQYGKRMLETFDKYWPRNVEIHAYYEGTKPDFINDRITYHDLLGECPSLVEFKERHKNDPVANGMPDSHGIDGGKRRPQPLKPKWQNSESFLWDAVRFSHKSYCQHYATMAIDADVIFWFDADTITFRYITEEAFSKWVPDGVYLSHLGRITYSECGFIGYNIRHPYHNEFMDRWKKMYDRDKIFKLDQWHDCMSFDYVRKQMEEEGKIENRDMNEEGSDKLHPFINCELGEYIDHLKGARKEVGSSAITDIKQNRNVDYWKDVIERRVMKPKRSK